MSEIFKRKRKVIVGGVASVVVAARWTIRYRDHLGVRRLKAGFIDRKATEQLAARLERDAERVRSGVLTPAESEGLHKTLADLIAEYATVLSHRGVCASYLEGTRSRLAAAFAGCKMTVPKQLSADRLAAWMSGKRKGVRFSHQTSNHYRRTLISFGSWLVQQEYLTRNPLATIPIVNVDANLVHVRRSISVTDFRKLVATTEAEASRTPWGMGGVARSWLYVVAAYTGFRARTLTSLTPSSFDLASTPPTATGTANNVKTGTAIVVPIPTWLAVRLTTWLATIPPKSPLFPGLQSTREGPGKLLSRDLADAGIPYRDADGCVFDFHALRDLYATWLVQSGASLSEVQKLLGHSTPSVTAKHYIRLKTGELAAPVERLPML